MCQYLAKMDEFEFLCLNMGKLLNYVRYSGSNNVVQGVVENWLVTEMGWVELDRVRWSRVEMVARFSNTHKATYSTYSFIKQMMKIMQTWNKRKENDHTALRAVDYTVQWRLLLHKVKFSKMKLQTELCHHRKKWKFNWISEQFIQKWIKIDHEV